MSLKFKNHEEYWQEVFPKLQAYLDSGTKQEIKDIIFTCIAFYGYVSEDSSQKVTVNKEISPKLDLFLAFAFDQLRASLVLYENLNLSPTAICARATFENAVSLRFIIKNSDSAKFADLYNRFRDIIRLRAHRNSSNLEQMSEAEVTHIKSSCPEWFDPLTGSLVKRPHWTAIKGMNFEQLVNVVEMTEYYTLYRTTSQFVHASPIMLNLYRGSSGFGAISSESNARQFAILICIFALETLRDYSTFFGIELDEGYYLGLLNQLNKFS